jgi:hypothetical protein
MTRERVSEDMEELYRSMAKRGRQANLSFFAFTATPKHKTLAVFGRDGQPSHRYTMRQAIEEEFILDVLRHYTTYATYYKLLKSCEDDPNVERKKGRAGSSALHAVASAQHCTEDRGYGRALPEFGGARRRHFGTYTGF